MRVHGGKTKVSWGGPVAPVHTVLETCGLSGVREHNAGDFTAVVGAGTPLIELQALVGAAGQRLALDPPLGAGAAATIGGAAATGDSGPLRHRFGGPRDLVLGVQVALPDGTLARAGGKVIKNVAGYDLAKLMTGAHGTLGVICEVTVRLHPLPSGCATVIVEDDDPSQLAATAAALAHAALEPICLDARWADGHGSVLARFAGRTAEAQARGAATRHGGTVRVDDEALWSAQRDAQRSLTGVIAKVSTTQRRLADLLTAGRDLGGRVVARAGLVLGWVELAGPDELAELRARLAPSPCVVQDAPEEMRTTLDAWGPPDAAKLALMRRVRERFDPRRTLNPGVFVGGL